MLLFWRFNKCFLLQAEYNAADVIVMTIIRCLAVLYCYYQFCKLQKLGSKYILACLSLILELSRITNIYSKKQCFITKAFKEEDHKSNPVVQRVKLIMSAGLMLVHAHSRWPFKEEDVDNIGPILVEQHMTLNRTEDTALHGYIMKWVTLSADHIVILILLLALVVKFIFFENKEDFAEQIRASMSENLKRDTREFLKLNQELRSKFHPAMPFFKPQETFFLGKNDVLDNHSEIEFEDKEVQTSRCESDAESSSSEDGRTNICRSLEQCLEIYNDSDLGAVALTDEEVILLVKNKHIAAYQIEKAIDDPERGVGIRRKILGSDGNFAHALADLPYKNYDYGKVMGACCENVIGYMPVPVGYAGPLLLDGQELFVPMATTEGCLVASTNRGCRALKNCGVTSSIVGDGMTRGPVVRFPSLVKASTAMKWMESPDNFALMKEQFDSSSRFARLSKILIRIAGRYLFIRFVAKTGDAMGMNMLSKGTELSLKYVQNEFPDMEILSLSGNFCTDKKPAAVNW
ncbi:hypothetical protein NQ314_010818 [Rhamnusium bicolor]|uniref:3-hydroxy-3-methylglutaryl-coenzyme A reductase n=1 Tax=Rhamnusium bicolor TaxID=1586634 RepID=A0AAV8XNL3_9CUCU|nr:hypothetical protein NQ314_010818 [Rhamnusium bicolor]